MMVRLSISSWRYDCLYSYERYFLMILQTLIHHSYSEEGVAHRRSMIIWSSQSSRKSDGFSHVLFLINLWFKNLEVLDYYSDLTANVRILFLKIPFEIDFSTQYCPPYCTVCNPFHAHLLQKNFAIILANITWSKHRLCGSAQRLSYGLTVRVTFCDHSGLYSFPRSLTSVYRISCFWSQ